MDNEIEARCACGAVALTLRGDPIVCLVCYCDTCQEGSHRIETLPKAPTVREHDGGTAYVSYRKDRVTIERGSELLAEITLEHHPKTKRVYASCCNAALLMRFDDARHWVPVYRARLGPNAPARQMRVCTRYTPQGSTIPTDVPSHPDYPGALALKLLSSRVAMLFRRG